MNERSNISVVLPSMGRASLLTAITSCQMQKNPFEQLIIVDDSVGQNISDELKSGFSDGLNILKTGGEKGANYARNLGLSEVNTRYVTFLDDDDFFLPHRNQFLAHTDIAIFVHRSLVYNEDYGTLKTSRQPVGIHNWRRLLRGNFAGAAPIVLTDLAKESGGFDETLRRGQDWDFNLRCAKISSVIEVSSNFSHVSCISNSRVRISNREESWENYRLVLEKHNEFSKSIARPYWQVRRFLDKIRLLPIG